MSLPVILLFIASFGWGLTWIPIKFFHDNGLPGIALVLVAFTALAIVFLPFFIRQFSHWRSQWHFILLIAFFGGMANLAFQMAVSYGDVIRVMILFYLLPVWSVLGGRIFLHEKIDRLRMLAVALALTGAFMILGGVRIFDSPPGWIDFWAIVSGFALAMNNITFRATQSLNMISKVSAVFLGCALMAGIYYLLADVELPEAENTTLGLAVFYGIAWITLITFGTQWPVTKIEAGRASIIIVTELVVAVVSSAILLQQGLSLLEITGAVMVISAAILEGTRATTT